jgi:hypothetical protein
MPKDKIPNIYVFCDRWCERCAFGSRCEAYAANEAVRKQDNLATDDETNRLFWHRIHKQLAEVISAIEREAKEHGVDLDVFEGLSKGKKFDLFQHKAVNNEVLKAGRKYEDAVDDWLDALADKGILRMMEFMPGSVFRVSDESLSEEKKNELNALIEVVMRYQLQIYLKISRLYYTQGREQEAEEQTPDQASDGAAKMVLELINRSLVAWWYLKSDFAGFEKETRSLIFLLMRIKKRIEKEFPLAETFVRPGFDEE